MSNKKPNLDSLFEAALKFDSIKRREEFLNHSCGNDTKLRNQIDRLLESHDKAGSFLNSDPERDVTYIPDTSTDELQLPDDESIVLTSPSLTPTMPGVDLNQIPQVSLQENAPEVDTRVEQPNSSEIPDDTHSRYRLDGEIARGGMGAVLRGRDKDLGREVAFKILLDAHKSNPDVIRRFIEEAQIGGQLQHPGIAPVYELGKLADERLFFSMKLVKGKTLANLLSDRKSSADDRSRFLTIFEHICQTVAYAHSRGVIHRDLKPANVMVGAFGEVQVMDWGLAKVLAVGGVADEKRAKKTQQPHSVIQTLRSGPDSNSGEGFDSSGSETRMGSVMGTPAYMPPEQALGEIDNMDQRADVFGLGAILCEILTEAPPYVGDTGKEVFRLASRGRIASCLERLDAADADPALISIAKSCLNLEPKDRPKDAGVLTEHVSGYLLSVDQRLRQIQMEKAAEGARAEEERKRRKMTLGLASIIVLALVAGTGLSTFFAIEAKENATVARIALSKAEEAKTRAEENATLAEHRLGQAQHRTYNDQLVRVAEARDSSPSQALKWLESDDDCPNYLREFTWKYLHQQLKKTNLTLSGHTAMVHDIKYSPDGQWLASAGFDKTLRIWNAKSGQQISVLNGHTGPVTSVCFSPDGKQLASCGHDTNARLWDVATGQLKHTLSGHTKDIGSVAISPDGSLVATAGSDGLIKLWNASTGEIERTISEHGSWVWCVAFSPDGKTIASAGKNTLVKLWNIETGTLRSTHPHSGEAFFVCYSPKGDFVAVTGFNQVMRLWDLKQGNLKWQLLAGHGYPHTCDFSPDGNTIAMANADHSIRFWDIQTGKPRGFIAAHDAAVKAVSYAPDGRSIASASEDQSIKVWQLQTDDIAYVVPGKRRLYRHLQFLPNNGLLVCNEINSNIIRLCNPQTGWCKTTLRGHRTSITAFSVSADGKLLASVDKTTLKLWDIATKSELRSITIEQPFKYIAFSNDNQTLITICADRCIRMRDATTLAVQKEIAMPNVLAFCLAASPVDSSFAIGGILDDSGDVSFVLIGDLKTGEFKHKLKGHRARVLSLAYSADGTLLATGADDREACLWNVENGKQLATLIGHTKPIRSITFTPDGKTLATGSEDGSIRLWDPVTAEHLATLKAHEGRVYSIAMNDKVMASTGSDFTVKLWDATSLSAEVKLERQLTNTIGTFSHTANSKKALIESVTEYFSASDSNRKTALDLVDVGWDGLVRDRALSLMYEFTNDHPVKADLITAIRTTPEIDDEIRADAIAVAGLRVEDARLLNKKSWAILSRRDRTAADYEKALRWIRRAAELKPDNGAIANTLGVGLYRMGKNDEALKLLRFDSKELRMQPIDWAYVALCEHKLGHDNESHVAFGTMLAKLERRVAGETKWLGRFETIEAVLEATSTVQNLDVIADVEFDVSYYAWAANGKLFPIIPKDDREQPKLATESWTGISKDWKYDSPTPSVPIDRFYAIIDGDVLFDAGKYQLCAVSDSGVRVYVDGKRVIDDWTGHGLGLNTAQLDVDEGSHKIHIEYFERTSKARLHLMAWPTAAIEPEK